MITPWRALLVQHHAQTGGVWLVSYKKSTGAKKPDTQAKRIEETTRLAQDTIRANQWRRYLA